MLIPGPYFPRLPPTGPRAVTLLYPRRVWSRRMWQAGRAPDLPRVSAGPVPRSATARREQSAPRGRAALLTAVAHQRAPCPRADHAVCRQPVGALEAPDRGAGDRAERPVHRQAVAVAAQAALHRADAGALLAVLDGQQRRGGGGRPDAVGHQATPPDRGDADRHRPVGGLHHPAPAEVHADVSDGGRAGPVAGVEDEVTGGEGAYGDALAGPVLPAGHPRDGHPGGPVGHARQAGAVVAGRSVATPLVWLAELVEGVADGDRGGRAARDGRGWLGLLEDLLGRQRHNQKGDQEDEEPAPCAGRAEAGKVQPDSRRLRGNRLPRSFYSRRH